MRLRRVIPAALAAAALSACGGVSARVSRGYDPARVPTVAVGEFSDYPKQPGSGALVARAFQDALAAAGWKVAAPGAAAAVLTGRVTDLDQPRASSVKVPVVDSSPRTISGVREVEQPYIYPGRLAIAATLTGADGAVLWSAADAADVAVLKDGARALADEILKAVAGKRR